MTPAELRIGDLVEVGWTADVYRVEGDGGGGLILLRLTGKLPQWRSPRHVRVHPATIVRVVHRLPAWVSEATDRLVERIGREDSS